MMRRPEACFDIDGTLAKGMLFVPLIEHEHSAGILDDNNYAAIVDLLRSYKTGKLEYETAVELLLQAHAKGLAGKEVKAVSDSAETFMEKMGETLFRGFGVRAAELLKHDNQLIIVTAEPAYLAQVVAVRFDMETVVSSIYETVDDTYTGKVSVSLADRSAKSTALALYDISYAFGDSEGDIEMLAAATHPFCICPNEGLEKEAELRGWATYGDDDHAIMAGVRATI